MDGWEFLYCRIKLDKRGFVPIFSIAIEIPNHSIEKIEIAIAIVQVIAGVNGPLDLSK